jgi:hypothetical protein
MEITLTIDPDKAKAFRAALSEAWEAIDYDADQLAEVDGFEEDAENMRGAANLIEELTGMFSSALGAREVAA